jgi:hypothetical protein
MRLGTGPLVFEGVPFCQSCLCQHEGPCPKFPEIPGSRCWCEFGKGRSYTYLPCLSSRHPDLNNPMDYYGGQREGTDRR